MSPAPDGSLYSRYYFLDLRNYGRGPAHVSVLLASQPTLSVGDSRAYVQVVRSLEYSELLRRRLRSSYSAAQHCVESEKQLQASGGLGFCQEGS